MINGMVFDDRDSLVRVILREWITKSLGCEVVPSASTLPWIWVVEALASSNQVDASLLIDLIKRIPEISDDLGKSAKEMFSFGILQNLFIKKIWKTDDTLSGAGSKIQLDPSQRCEDVLCKILHEISASNVKTGGTHMLKWDIQSFIAHKRSTLPQSVLLQLKDMIINGSDPHLSTLKERSGLLTPNQSGNANPTSLDVNASNGTIGHMCGEQNFKPLVENGNSLACTQNNETNKREILHDRDLVPGKKRKCVSVDNQGRKSFEERILLDDNCDVPCASGVTKKCKRSAGSDKDCEHITDCIENEGCNLENESQAGGLEGSGSDAACKDITDAELRNSNNAKLSLVQEISHSNETKRKSHHNLSNDGPTNEARVGVDGFHEPELCSDSDEYHEERIDIASKKTMFLSSQCTHSQDSLLTTDLTEINLCMKCHRGGELLVCSSEACPLVVHNGCLGSSPSFENDGKFYCPFCSYCRAISEYMEVKKKASLARKDLASFVGVRIEQPPRNFPTRPIGSKTSQSMQDEELCGKGKANSSRFSLNEANSPQCKANTDEKQQEQQTISSPGDGPPSKYKMISSTNARPFTLEKDSSSNGDDDQHHNETLAITIYNMHGLPHGDPRSSNQNEPSCEVEVEKENVPQRVISLHHQLELTSGTDDVEESSDEEKGKFQASKYCIRFHNPEKQYSYPAISQWRRKKVPWTKDEEEALKEGVDRCKSIGSRNIPWKEILEYGGDRFRKGRTAMDLKDKWRNICKGSPNAT